MLCDVCYETYVMLCMICYVCYVTYAMLRMLFDLCYVMYVCMLLVHVSLEHNCIDFTMLASPTDTVTAAASLFNRRPRTGYDANHVVARPGTLGRGW
jgi:hypothetical protein